MWWRPLGIFNLILCALAVFGCSDDTIDEVTAVGTPTNNMMVGSNSGADSLLPLAPNFTLLSTELEEVRLTDYQGKVVLLDLWATWCKPCEEEIPLFIELYDQYRTQGFEMLGISLDDEGLKIVDPFIEKLGINYTILLGEPGILDKYDIPVIPSAFLIDRSGRIVKVFAGAQGEKGTYEKELKKLL